jgi:hypothetical protein
MNTGRGDSLDRRDPLLDNLDHDLVARLRRRPLPSRTPAIVDLATLLGLLEARISLLDQVSCASATTVAPEAA